jgi:hypothetical protein
MPSFRKRLQNKTYILEKRQVKFDRALEPLTEQEDTVLQQQEGIVEEEGDYAFIFYNNCC